MGEGQRNLEDIGSARQKTPNLGRWLMGHSEEDKQKNPNPGIFPHLLTDLTPTASCVSPVNSLQLEGRSVRPPHGTTPDISLSSFPAQRSAARRISLAAAAASSGPRNVTSALMDFRLALRPRAKGRIGVAAHLSLHLPELIPFH